MDLVDRYGELLFGRRIRLRVSLWVLAQGSRPFNQSEAARGINYSSSGEVAKELERLVELDMLRKFGRPLRIGPQNYVPLEHPGWDIIRAAAAAISAGSPGGVEREPPESPVASM